MSTNESNFTPGNDSNAAQPVVMDEDYFMDVPVTFQVENYLFRVPRYHLVKGSETFAKMFQSQQTEGSFEGCSAEYPIMLPGVSHGDFRNFLKLVYPQTVSRRVSLSKAEWLSVLRLSNLWYFRDLRRMALEELKEDNFGHLSALEKIKVGRECYIMDCLLSGYLGFVTRHEFITDKEATAIGPLTAIRLCRFREKFFRRKAGEKVLPQVEIVVEFRQEFVDLDQRAVGYLPSSGPAGSSSLGEVVTLKKSSKDP